MKLGTFITAAVFVSGTIAAFGQEVTTPKFETGFNYTFTRINAGGNIGSYSANGGSGYAEYNLNRYVGLVADLGGNTVGTANGIPLNNTEFTYLFGPRFNWRTAHRFTPYVQTLAGGARFSNAYDSNLGFPVLGGAQNNFAAMIGGGVDFQINDHLSVKPLEVDYLMTQLPNSFSNVNEAQNNLRYSAGVVFRFGSK
jgi:hypothetical protein